MLAVNSCLLPVGALEGCHIITSEGLGNSRTGFNQVQGALVLLAVVVVMVVVVVVVVEEVVEEVQGRGPQLTCMSSCGQATAASVR